jgi:hypothetical protein
MDSISVATHVDRAVGLWHACAGPWARPPAGYTERGQRIREKAYDQALGIVERTARRAGRGREGDIEGKLIAAFAQFAAHALDLDETTIGSLTRDFLPVGTGLARWARHFDATLSNADIIQACRNAWTACGLQPLLGAPMRLTPAILGYSLLYPYSDNYLDQERIAREEKLRFNGRFRLRLRGEAVDATNEHEAAVWEMVRLIEGEFPRAEFPRVFESLLAIHRAQGESLRQLEQCGELELNELERITCAKGGTSVLADGFLVRGELDAEQSEFAFLWGVLLQLGDDLQDVREDLQRGSDTVFTRAARAGRTLDGLVAQLLNLSDAVAARMDVLPCGTRMHKALLRMSWRSLVLMAVAHAHEHFTPGFLAELESRSPFRFGFLRARRERLHGEAGLFRSLFELIVRSGGGAGGRLPLPEPAAHTTRAAVTLPVLLAEGAGRVAYFGERP